MKSNWDDVNYGFGVSTERDRYNYDRGGENSRPKTKEDLNLNWHVPRKVKHRENPDINWLMVQRQLDTNSVNGVNKVLERWVEEYNKPVNDVPNEYMVEHQPEINGFRTECLKLNLKQIIIDILGDIGVSNEAVVALINQKILEYSLTLDSKFTNKIKLINYEFVDFVEIVDIMYVIKSYGDKWIVKKVQGIDSFVISYSCSDLHRDIILNDVAPLVNSLEYKHLNDLNI